MPLSKFQSDVLRLLAAQRSPDSYIAGGIVINRQGPRFSGDINIFHDSAARLEEAVMADEAALATAGYKVTWSPTQRTERREATVEKADAQMQLEWVTDAAFRFFPTQPDELFGYVLHPAAGSVPPTIRRGRSLRLPVTCRNHDYRCRSKSIR